MRISDWSSDVCSADLIRSGGLELGDVNDRLFLEHGARIGADRDRNRLQAFLGFSRDDDDFLNAAAIGMLRFIGWWRRSLCKYGDRVAGHQHRAERQRRTNKSLHLDFLPPAWGAVPFMQTPSSREARDRKSTR